MSRWPGDRSHGQRCYPMPAPASPPGRAFALHRPDREHVDVAVLAQRDLLRPLDRFLHRVAVAEVEPAEDLFRLGEGPVGDLTLAGLEADAGRLGIGAQAFAVDHLLGRLQLLGEALVTS